MNAIIAQFGSLGSVLREHIWRDDNVTLFKSTRRLDDVRNDAEEVDAEDVTEIADAPEHTAPPVQELDAPVQIVRHSLEDVFTSITSEPIHFAPDAVQSIETSTELMSSSHENAQHALMLESHAANQLIVSLLDNADEYRRAIFAAEELLNSLQHRLFNRVQAAEQLQAHVRSLGIQPATTRSTLAAEFAARVETPRLFGANRQDELMQDVERGERTLHRQFSRCLKQDWLSTKGRECLTETFEKLTSSNRLAMRSESSLFGPLAQFAAQSLSRSEPRSSVNSAASEVQQPLTEATQFGSCEAQSPSSP